MYGEDYCAKGSKVHCADALSAARVVPRHYPEVNFPRRGVLSLKDFTVDMPFFYSETEPQARDGFEARLVPKSVPKVWKMPLVNVNKKPGYMHFCLRADLIQHCLVPWQKDKVHRPSVAANRMVDPGFVSTFCTSFQTGMCTRGCDELFQCKAPHSDKRARLHRCQTCLGGHPACVCPYAERNPLDTRCPCPSACPPFLCPFAEANMARTPPNAVNVTLHGL